MVQFFIEIINLSSDNFQKNDRWLFRHIINLEGVRENCHGFLCIIASFSVLRIWMKYFNHVGMFWDWESNTLLVKCEARQFECSFWLRYSCSFATITKSFKIYSTFYYIIKTRQNRRRTHNVKLRPIRESLLPWKSNKYYIFVCVCARARGCVCVSGCPARGHVHASAHVV
jgi:hypothetical protein